MTFREWQQLSPESAAATVHERARTRLRPGQQRAVLAWLAPEAELARDLAAGRREGGPLAGVPFFAKDLFDAAGLPTFAGSTFLPELRPPSPVDGALIAAVRKTGAVLAGKTQMHEFAYGITGENPHYGDCEHPRFPGRTTGGSSSGSAAAVAAGVVPFALGSDTGGSVRVPAAFCGVFGFRLQPGDAWIRDAFPLAPTFDTAGWFTATAEDMLATLEALVREPPAADTPTGRYLEMPGVDPAVARACRAAAETLAAVAEPTLAEPLHRAFAPALEAYHTTVAHEAWQVHQGWAERYRERYDPVVWPRLLRGQSLPAAQVASAAANRAAIRQVWADYFARHDFLILPASPAPALTKADCTLENRNRVLTLTAPASIGGLPVLTVPVPLADGLTTGLQLIVREPTSPVLRWALDRFGTAA